MYIPWRRSNHCIVNGEELQQDGLLGEGDGVGVDDEDGGGGSHPAGAKDGFKEDSTRGQEDWKVISVLVKIGEQGRKVWLHC